MTPAIDQSGLRGKTRDRPICADLELVLRRAAEAAGVDKVFITSGGQPGTKGGRTGSTRHDGGRAADLRLMKDGRTLSFADEAADPAIEAFVTAAAANGAIGIGAGVHYMGPDLLHVGFGTSIDDRRRIVWGAGGRSANAPAWLRAAAERGWKEAVETPISNGGNVVSSSLPPPAMQLLDFIGELEAGAAGYEVIFGNRQRAMPRRLTSLTVDEVFRLQAQLLRQGSPSTAVGRYQFLRKTLQGLVNELGIEGSRLFGSGLQDQLGFRLLQQCGYPHFVRRRMPPAEFALNLARTWASLPVLQTVRTSAGTKTRGQSYYESGLNHARVGADRFEALLNDVLTTAQRVGTQTPGKVSPMPQPSPPFTPVGGDEAKPWYLSRGVIGGLIAAAVPLAALFYPQAKLINPTDATDWVMRAIQVGGPVLGGVVAMMGRVGATQPIAGTAAAKAAQEQKEASAPPSFPDAPDMMTLPFWQVVSQLPNILAGLQQMQAAAGAFGMGPEDGPHARAHGPFDLIVEADGDRADQAVGAAPAEREG